MSQRTLVEVVLIVVVFAIVAVIVRPSPAKVPVVPSPVSIAPAFAAPREAPTLPAVVLPPAREPGEWQGMRVDADDAAVCDESARCGMGLACVDGRCGACAADADCAVGEACVLDHCVPAPQVACRGRADCGSGELCVLSGVSGDARGNAGMTASCLAPAGGQTQRPVDHAAAALARVTVPAAPSAVSTRSLLDGL